MQLHPQEDLLQEARALQRSEDFARYRQHRLARLVKLGIRQARYFGRAKTRFQLYLAATVANLTLGVGKAGLPGDIDGAATGSYPADVDTGSAAANAGTICLDLIWPLSLLTTAFLPSTLVSIKAFQPDF